MGNLYWCDFMYDWIVMKLIFIIKMEIYNVVICIDLDYFEGLVLDFGDRYLFFKRKFFLSKFYSFIGEILKFK